eukprot:UN11404
MDWIFLHTFGLFVITFCLISAFMMCGYWINARIYPSIRGLTQPKIFNKLSFREKREIIDNAPRSALYSVAIIRFLSCIIACALFSYYAPNPAKNEFCFLFEIIIIVMYQIGEHYNQKDLPHPKWYNKYGLGYIPWMPGVIIGHFVGISMR